MMWALPQMKKSWVNTIKKIGIPIVLKAFNQRFSDKSMIAGFKTAGWSEQELMNAYGVGTKIITFNGEDFEPMQSPLKFDEVTLENGEILMLDEVYPVYLQSDRLGYKAYCKGAGE